MASTNLGFGAVNTTLNSNNNGDDEKQKTKRLIVLIVVVMIVLAIVAAVLLVLISKGEKPKLSLNIDGTPAALSEIYYEYDKEQESWFFSVKDLATRLKYTYNRGGTDITDESEANCIIVNPNKLEKILFESNKREIVKYYTYDGALVPNQHFDTKNMIKFDSQNTRILADQSAIERAFNCIIDYDEETLKLSIKTLEGSLVRTYANAEPNAINNGNNGNGIEDKVRFQNNKAMLRGFVVVKEPNGSLLGINQYDSSTGKFKILVGTKYKSIQFIEGINKFIVQSENNKYGIIAESGSSDIEINYSYLTCIDIKKGLYVAGVDNGKQCIVAGASAATNYQSKIIVPADYDKIGISGNTFNDDKLESNYILCGTLIPVNKGGKWGFYSTEGDQVVGFQYDGIGCPAPQGAVTGGRANIKGCVIIPNINAIVVKLNLDVEDSNNKAKKADFYGLIDYKGELKVAVKATAIFSSTENNKRTYYYGNDQQQYDIEQFWIDNNLGHTTYTNIEEKDTNSITESPTPADQNSVQNSVVTPVQNQVETPVVTPVQNQVENPVETQVQNPVETPVENNPSTGENTVLPIVQY